ncbi:MAG: hypothetical protein FWB84_05395 [Candidatus Bathyarchaeota archaeon]|uniref:hypothetical protein n=1 Tax=Candidatus Bathycorpusculum sp. TaxID=2994959 RepID=UPI00281FE297|nr:hypothetical protein [Candidatus Termiticorpusculum sp.]MCL2256663.1 hypothetical protein [Candidatus Termiticorpusculum sp.]MCL2292798.1 hypothetical protein [Candidatus Termiticorpusculum sp.]
MNKLKVFLTVITILIAVTPITVQVIRYHENPVDLILPPSISAILKGGPDDLVNADYVDFAGMAFPLPILTGEPVFTQDNNLLLTYNFTNPLDGKITIASMDAEIVCVDHEFALGDVFIEPATLEPHQTLDLTVTCHLTPETIEHIKAEHQGQDSIKTEFTNYSVDLTDIKINMPHRKLGIIHVPMTILTLNNLLFR